MGTGNTHYENFRRYRQTVHPRGHGEHYQTLRLWEFMNGSSPWARGTLGRHITIDNCKRFIPVGTGNTATHPVLPVPVAVHPRGHGEHASSITQLTGIIGSSPWARGTHQEIIKLFGEIRFIPVGTGNTYALSRRTLCIAVHPRGHGEHQAPQRMPVAAIGSSPWARGTQTLGKYCLVFRRFIPVGTGNTAPP